MPVQRVRSQCTAADADQMRHRGGAEHAEPQPRQLVTDVNGHHRVAVNHCRDRPLCRHAILQHPQVRPPEPDIIDPPLRQFRNPGDRTGMLEMPARDQSENQMLRVAVKDDRPPRGLDADCTDLTHDMMILMQHHSRPAIDRHHDQYAGDNAENKTQNIDHDQIQRAHALTRRMVLRRFQACTGFVGSPPMVTARPSPPPRMAFSSASQMWL